MGELCVSKQTGDCLSGRADGAVPPPLLPPEWQQGPNLRAAPVCSRPSHPAFLAGMDGGGASLLLRLLKSDGGNAWMEARRAAASQRVPGL